MRPEQAEGQRRMRQEAQRRYLDRRRADVRLGYRAGLLRGYVLGRLTPPPEEAGR